MNRSVIILYGAAILIAVGGAIDVVRNRAVRPAQTATDTATTVSSGEPAIAKRCFGLQREIIVAYQPFAPFLTPTNPPNGYVANVINTALADAGCGVKWEMLSGANGDIIVAPPHNLTVMGTGNFNFNAPFASLVTQVVRAKNYRLDTLQSGIVLAERDLIEALSGCCGKANLEPIDDVTSGLQRFLSERAATAIVLHPDRTIGGTNPTSHAIESVKWPLRTGFRTSLAPHETALNAALQKAASSERLRLQAHGMPISPGGT